MAKRASKKLTTLDILRGVTVTIVARKDGEEEKQKDMVYEEALKAKKQFQRLGWRVDLFQQGYYRPAK